MNKYSISILVCFIIILSSKCINAQLYSSGNNVIAGSNVGIGTASPAAKLHVSQSAAGFVDHLRMTNSNSAGAGKFTLYGDGASNYFTFTKYGSTFAGGYPGVTTFFPYAGLTAFGNNGGGTLMVSNGGNMGLGLYINSTTYLKFFANYTTGKVGIHGNTDPKTQVHISATTTGDTLKITNNSTGHLLTDGLDIGNTGTAAFITNRENNTLTFGTNNTTRMTILGDGKVLIGTATTPTGYKLYVETGILTEKVKVALKAGANWADYVFAEDYKLQPLTEVEKYIKEHKHLPGVPSAQEVVDNGLDLAAMDAKLLEKIEELTLHMIKINNDMETLKNENAALKKRIEEYKK